MTARSTRQARSNATEQEDGTFKSDYSTLGSNVTLGTGTLVHYGVTIGDGAELATNCCLMKGEQVPAGARWSGNPAHEIRDRQLVAAGSRGRGEIPWTY